MISMLFTWHADVPECHLGLRNRRVSKTRIVQAEAIFDLVREVRACGRCLDVFEFGGVNDVAVDGDHIVLGGARVRDG